MDIKDKKLWKVAQLRARFKNSLITYLIVNSALVAFWYFGSGSRNFFWPVFSISFWGLGLVFSYFHAYIDKGQLAEKEYEKLLREKQ